MLIRSENSDDRDAVYAVNVSAFETSAEAKLVDALRLEARPIVSLVAEEDGEVVGHIMFSPVTLSENPTLEAMGLAPMAVVPKQQRKGIGTLLVRAGLERCKQLGFAGVVVLGHPDFYLRFGFAPASKCCINSEYDVPDDLFMAVALQPGALDGRTGTVRYHPAFGSL